MELTITTANKTSSQGTVSVSETTFSQDFNEALVHQVVVAYLAGARAGTRAHKNRAERNGGGKKPWRQKGTGRARAGTIRSPLWRKGGVTFAAEPQDHSQKVNKKMYRGAMRSILSELIRQERLIVVDDVKVELGKTREMVELLKKFDCSEALIVIDGKDDLLARAANNLYRVEVQDAVHVDPVSLIKHENIIVTVSALTKLEERLK